MKFETTQIYILVRFSLPSSKWLLNITVIATIIIIIIIIIIITIILAATLYNQENDKYSH